MLAQFVAIGLLSAPSEGPITDTGNVIATSNRTAFVLGVQADTPAIAGLPNGAVAWKQQFDPGDHAPYALDFSALLDTAEEIASIDAISMNATAALLGVGVDGAAGYSPIIDEAGKKVQVWFIVDEASWQAVSFAVAGVQLPVTIRVSTDSTPPKRYERTAVIVVRQL